MKNLLQRDDIFESQATLIYGSPFTGKTLLAGTLAKLPHIQRIWWLDLERGINVLRSTHIPEHLKLTEQEAQKIIPITFSDTASEPIAASRIYSLFTTTTPLHVNQEEGRLFTQSPANVDTVEWQSPLKMADNEAIVIDSLSQLTSSVEAMFRNEGLTKFEFWGAVQQRMHAILGVIQAAHIPVVAITHIVVDEVEVMAASSTGKVTTKSNPRMVNDTRTTKVYPLVGSKATSFNAARYFNHALFCLVKDGRYWVVSSPTTLDYTNPGTTSGRFLEKLPNPTLADLDWSTSPEPR